MADRNALLLRKLAQSVKALDASVRMLNQQIKVIKRNEKILARSIINLNRKVNALSSQKGEGVDESKLKELSDRIDKLQRAVDQLLEDVTYLKSQLKTTLTSEDVSELKYIVETINPLEFVTYDQVGELVEKKLRELGIIR